MNKQTAIKRGLCTRRLYAWEKRTVEKDPVLSRERSLLELQYERDFIWSAYGSDLHRRKPTLRFGPGTKELGGVALSYTIGFTLIELAPGQRNRVTLLHELTHALGPVTHNGDFSRLYCTLLLAYIPRENQALRDVVINELWFDHPAYCRQVYKR